jgi:hypothetical protein
VSSACLHQPVKAVSCEHQEGTFTPPRRNFRSIEKVQKHLPESAQIPSRRNLISSGRNIYSFLKEFIFHQEGILEASRGFFGSFPASSQISLNRLINQSSINV